MWVIPDAGFLDSGCRIPSVKRNSLNAIFRMSLQKAFYKMVALTYMCVACLCVYVHVHVCYRQATYVVGVETVPHSCPIIC